MRLILVGPRSVGKTTVGRLLARHLKTKYLDFDKFVEDNLKGIDSHITKYGIASYRRKEEKLLQIFARIITKNCVISVGGGTVASQFSSVSKRNSTLLKKLGTIIYLTPFDDVHKSVSILHLREKIRGGNKSLEETLKLFKLRKSSYEKNCDLKIIVNHKKPQGIVREIISKLSNQY